MIIHYTAEKNIFVVVYRLLSTADILKSHFNDYFKINGKQMIKMPKIGEYVRLKNYKRKIKSPFMIYADFESISLPKDSKKQNPDEFYGYRLVHVDDKFSKPFKPQLVTMQLTILLIVCSKKVDILVM